MSARAREIKKKNTCWIAIFYRVLEMEECVASEKNVLEVRLRGFAVRFCNGTVQRYGEGEFFVSDRRVRLGNGECIWEESVESIGVCGLAKNSEFGMDVMCQIVNGENYYSFILTPYSEECVAEIYRQLTQILDDLDKN